MSDESGNHELVDLEEELPEALLNVHDVLFYYTSRTQTQPVQLRIGEAIAALRDTDFTPARPTYVIVHGWHNSNTSLLNTLVSQAVLSHEDYNILVTDWSSAASSLYTIARVAVPTVGLAVSTLIVELAIDSSLLTLVGHSLGAHSCGIAGSALNPARLIALDPALPLFELTGVEGRLDVEDAEFVEVIHTCGGTLGWLGQLGDVDFYPGRGGRGQPGCGEDLLCACAHARAYVYYAESLRTGGFTATECDTYEGYVDGTCGDNARGFMGGIELDLKANGTYFLHVNNREPYSLG